MTAATVEGLDAVLDRFAPVDLATLTSMANLQTRIDRKYLLAPDVVEALLEDLRHGTWVLQIGTRRSFGYESVYFDTPDLRAYRAAAHGRRRRFKVRTRTYLDSGECVLEVKTSSGRGETVKARREHALEHRACLTPEAATFIRDHISPGAADLGLSPVLITTFHRSTVLAKDGAFRMTCDVGLVCAVPDGASTALREHVLVETKSAGSPTLPDRLLWAAGHRPVTVSKYCVGLGALHDGLPVNRWHRAVPLFRGSLTTPWQDAPRAGTSRAALPGLDDDRPHHDEEE